MTPNARSSSLPVDHANPRRLPNAFESAPAPDRPNQSVEPATNGLLSPRDVALVEAVAQRVLGALEARPLPRLVDASTLAGVLGVSRSTVYEHAEQLGGLEVGGGTRPRLRFDVDRTPAAWTSRYVSERSQPSDVSIRKGSRRRRRGGLGHRVRAWIGAMRCSSGSLRRGRSRL
jgi:hypothetical protein